MPDHSLSPGFAHSAILAPVPVRAVDTDASYSRYFQAPDAWSTVVCTDMHRDSGVWH